MGSTASTARFYTSSKDVSTINNNNINALNINEVVAATKYIQKSSKTTKKSKIATFGMNQKSLSVSAVVQRIIKRTVRLTSRSIVSLPHSKIIKSPGSREQAKERTVYNTKILGHACMCLVIVMHTVAVGHRPRAMGSLAPEVHAEC